MGYFSFFLQEMCDIATDFNKTFPTFIRDSFTYSVDNDALRHSVLASSSVIVDKRQGKDLVRFHHHRQQTYRYVREQLASGEIDAPLVAAIFWTQYMDLIYGDFDAAVKHNKGLFLVLQNLVQDRANILNARATNIPPLCYILWRHGIRSDVALSHWINGAELSFPPIRKDQEDLHRGWMTNYARGSPKEDAVEWASASFNLECFLHRACHIANDFIKFRVNGLLPPSIAADFEIVKQDLITEHLEWWNRPVIQKACAEGLLVSTVTATRQPSFLDYPPIPPIRNHLFLFLRNIWHANYIYISILNSAPDVL
jgi:hypothetical protein